MEIHDICLNGSSEIVLVECESECEWAIFVLSLDTICIVCLAEGECEWAMFVLPSDAICIICLA